MQVTVLMFGSGMLRFWGGYSALLLLVLDSILVRSVSICVVPILQSCESEPSISKFTLDRIVLSLLPHISVTS
jgi:hypothetical protein